MQTKWFTKIILILLGCVIGCLSYGAYLLFWRPMLPAGESSRVLAFDKSTTASSFVHTLDSQDLISSPKLLLLLIRMRHVSHKLQAGIYSLKPGVSVAEFLDQVIRGDVLVLPFRIIEGTTQNDVTRDAEKAPYFTFHASDWVAIQGDHLNADGLLLADTYHYDAGSQAKQLFERAHGRLERYLETVWETRDPTLPYNRPYELLIAASIIEKETALSSEKKIISGVIVNRLAKKMRLQMDPTVIYALRDHYTGTLSRRDLFVESPYNTYRRQGLPPTPIAMLGKEAIEAAAHPVMSNYLYYVAKGDGSHEFSETYAEQRAAIKKYLRKDE